MASGAENSAGYRRGVPEGRETFPPLPPSLIRWRPGRRHVPPHRRWLLNGHPKSRCLRMPEFVPQCECRPVLRKECCNPCRSETARRGRLTTRPPLTTRGWPRPTWGAILEMSDNGDRWEPMNFYSLADDYYKSAIYIVNAQERDSLSLNYKPFVPYYLFSHAVELALKGFLRAKGLSKKDLKNKYNHKFRKLINDGICHLPRLTFGEGGTSNCNPMARRI
jgi:hypothetical protein